MWNKISPVAVIILACYNRIILSNYLSQLPFTGYFKQTVELINSNAHKLFFQNDCSSQHCKNWLNPHPMRQTLPRNTRNAIHEVIVAVVFTLMVQALVKLLTLFDSTENIKGGLIAL